jgi:diguanylate cyclase (GGDEF)-like protein
MRGLLDALLTTHPRRRQRLAQALLAMAMMAAGIVAMHYFVWVGVAPALEVGIWTGFSVLGLGGAFVAIRSGWSERFDDPSLTAAQMVYSLTCGAAAYAIVGAGRGGVFPIVMVILMFGMFIATPRQMAFVSLYAVGVFGAVMLLMSRLRPAVYMPAIELGHFVMVATMVPAASLVAARISRLRERSRGQRAELSAALGRIRELATRDELTGLVNRRHLLELMAQEHQRCIRSGHTFCVAVLAIDDFAPLAARLGAAAADDLVRGVAQESQRWVRVADVLAYWDGASFVLLMSDTRALLARGGLDRLRDRVAEARVVADPSVRVSLSAGLAEHHAGETVTETLARAERALADSRARGANRVHIA